jgi:serine/threonine-protein kinase
VVSRQFPRSAGKTSQAFRLLGKMRRQGPLPAREEARRKVQILMTTTLPKAGRYQLIGELGRGAMGVVYRAHDPVIGREVAVKTMHLTVGDSNLSRPELIQRFQTEARAAGILTHPNIVVVFDAGEEGGLFFITMELVEGRSLQVLLEGHQAFPMTRAIRILEQACSALDYAHKHNIVHRDIKPANLMLTDDDTLKITDFGTAKILRFNVTQTAHVIGTPSYMSPEQIKGKPVDGRSDIFALGVILYEMVTGEKPFPGENITTVIFKIINEEPIPPRKLDPSIHPGLSAVITRALAKEPTARFQNCAEMLAALRNYRNFGGNHKEDSQATQLDANGQPGMAMRPGAPLPVAAGTVPLTAMGHTLYEAPKPRRFWPSFWLAIFLLGVIGVTGYYVLPSARDVWNVVRTNISRPAGQSNSAPAVTTPAATPPVAPPKTKSANPPANKSQQAANLGSAPQQKIKVEATDSPVKESAGSSAPASSTPAPPAGPQPSDSAAPSAPSLAVLKNRIEQKLAEAKMADRVHVSIAADGLVLDGRLRAGEHQVLVNQLRQLPGWLHVSDDILFDSTPIATPAAPAGTPAAGTGINFTSQPDHAIIFINGQRQESTTPAALSLTPGKYNLMIRKANFAPYLSQIEVKQGEMAQVNVVLTERQQPEGVTFGFVNVTSTPPGAEIHVDGKATGQRTPAQIQMTAGQHTIALWSGGKVIYRRNVIVQANQVAQFSGTAQ